MKTDATFSGARFSRWAAGYERDGLAPLLLRVQAHCLALLRLDTADRLLDVGCATGRAVRQACAVAEKAVGIDLCETMLTRAALTPGRMALDRLAFARADATALPFKAGSFSAVLCTSALRHFQHRGIAMEEMLRVLLPGGRIVVGDFPADTSDPARTPLRAEPFNALAWPGLSIATAQWVPTPIGRYGIILAVGNSRGIPISADRPPA